jgi:hypothetical protein
MRGAIYLIQQFPYHFGKTAGCNGLHEKTFNNHAFDELLLVFVAETFTDTDRGLPSDWNRNG